MPSTTVADALMETFVIEGSQPLNGRIRAAGNKNGALPILAACLLTEEPVTLTNVPRIRDVETMVELLAQLGADLEWAGANEVRVHATDLITTEVDEELAAVVAMNGFDEDELLRLAATVERASEHPLADAIVIVLTRLRYDPATRVYAQQRRAEGKTNREIRRCLVRYVARQLYRLLGGQPAL